MLKTNNQNINVLEISDHTPTSMGSKFIPQQKNSSFSKENNFILNNINPKNKLKYINIKSLHNQEKTTTNEDSNSKFSCSQNNMKKKRPLMKSASYKNRKREREKILKLFRNNERIKIPKCKRKSNAEPNSKLDFNNLEKINQTPVKERKDSFGNIITKDNKKNFHISFQDYSPKKKLIDIVPIQSFKKFNIIEQNKTKTTKPYISRCCEIF